MGKPAVVKKNDHKMVMVKCPGRGNAPAWANSSNKGPRCTACGQTGHDVAPVQR